MKKFMKLFVMFLLCTLAAACGTDVVVKNEPPAATPVIPTPTPVAVDVPEDLITDTTASVVISGDFKVGSVEVSSPDFAENIHRTFEMEPSTIWVSHYSNLTPDRTYLVEVVGANGAGQPTYAFTIFHTKPAEVVVEPLPPLKILSTEVVGTTDRYLKLSINRLAWYNVSLYDVTTDTRFDNIETGSGAGNIPLIALPIVNDRFYMIKVMVFNETEMDTADLTYGFMTPPFIMASADYPVSALGTQVVTGTTITRIKLTNINPHPVYVTSMKFTDSGFHSAGALPTYQLYYSSQSSVDYKSNLANTASDSLDFGTISNPVQLDGGASRYFSVVVKNLGGSASGDVWTLSIANRSDIKFAVIETDMGYDYNGNSSLGDTIVDLPIANVVQLAAVTKSF